MMAPNDIVLADEAILDPAEIRSVLSERAVRLLRRGAAHAASPRVTRLVVPVERLDPFSWLQAQTLHPRIYWAGRADGVEFAAVGAADRCVGDAAAGYDTLRGQLDRVLAYSDEQVRYFGGFRFDPVVSSDGRWASFGTYRFVLPRFELDRRGGDDVLVCNLLLPRDRTRVSEILADIDRLVWPDGPLGGELPLPSGRRDAPDRAGWHGNVDRALATIAGDGLEKVVLARRAAYTFDEPLDPVLLLARLRAATPDCFHFCFQPDGGPAFVGASPERLFRREGRGVWTEAVAGTRPRGATAQHDRLLRDELLHSEKDLREHAYVRHSIHDALTPLCDVLDVDAEPSEMALSQRRHLVSRACGQLHDGVHGSDVMRALHPTPAVGGHPTARAVDAIRTWEPFDRGWYAGPVGWIGTHGAEFAVAIRSGLVERQRLSLFSGAGIVEGSTAEAEWEEIEQKIADFARVLGLG